MGYSSCLHKPCILSLACLAFSPIDCDHCEIIEEFYGESIGAEERDSLQLLAVNYVVVRFLYFHEPLDRLIEGEPDVLIDQGELRKDALEQELITLAELE